MSEPSAGALRAAEAIWNEDTTDVVNAADIIDRETGLPELLEALKRINYVISADYGHSATRKLNECAQIARAALAKAKGEA